MFKLLELDYVRLFVASHRSSLTLKLFHVARLSKPFTWTLLTSMLMHSVHPVRGQEILSTCSLNELGADGVNYIQRYSAFNVYDNFELNANIPVKISLSSVRTAVEPSSITRDTRVILNVRHLDQGISHMTDWVTKDEGSAAFDALNSQNGSSHYRLWGYIRNLTAPGEYSYSVTINCLL